MKKILALVLVLMMSFTFVACEAKVKVDDTRKVYVAEYEEELEGENYTFTLYLILNEDHSGYHLVTDFTPLTWDDEKLTYFPGTEIEYSVPYEISEDGEELTILNEEFKELYIRKENNIEIERMIKEIEKLIDQMEY